MSARAATTACWPGSPSAASAALLDLHRDPDHHRTVLTLAGRPRAGGDAARALGPDRGRPDSICAATRASIPGSASSTWSPSCRTRRATCRPRDLTAAIELRDDFAAGWPPSSDVPSFLYGPARRGHPQPAGPAPPGLRPAAGTAASSPTSGPLRPAPHGGRHGRGRPTRARGLQRLGLLRRDGPAGRAPGAQPAGPRPGPRRGRAGPGLVQPRRPGPLSARPTLYDAVAAWSTAGGRRGRGGRAGRAHPRGRAGRGPTGRSATRPLARTPSRPALG